MQLADPNNGNQVPGLTVIEEVVPPDSRGQAVAGTRVMQANLWDTFQRSLWALRRRAWLVVLVFTVSMAIAVVSLNNEPDVYRAQGKLIVAPRIANIVQDAYSDADPRFYATQTEIMEGNILRGRVERRLSHFQDRYGRLPDHRPLRAELPRISSIFKIYMDSVNGEFARQYVDLLFDEFMKYKREQKLGLSGTALETFAREISEKSKELKISEDELFEYQKKNPDIYVEGQASAVHRQMSELSSNVVKLKTDIDLLQKLKTYFYQARTSGGTATQIRTLGAEEQKYLENTTWLDARKELDTLLAQQAQMATMLKPAHPKMQSVVQSLQLAQRRLDQETEKAEQRMRQDIEAKQLQLGVYEKQMTELTHSNLESVEKMTEYQKLMNNVDRTKRLYDEMVSHLSQINVSIDTTQEHIAIHEPAILSTPASPNRRQTLIMAALIGIGIGCGLVVIIDRILHKVATPEQVESELGLDLIGVIPRMRVSARRPTDRLFSAHTEQAGFAESFRTLRSVLVQQRKHRVLQVLQITSPQPSEGKTFISANLAATLAVGGVGNVLLVGADLRRGDVHRIFDIKSKTGLAEILGGTCDWKSQIFSTPFENLHVIASGKTPTDPAQALQAPIMVRMIEEWRSYYEWVILDCPPLVAISDSIILAPLCDATIMVLRSDSTPTRVAFTALDILSRRARPALGAVLNALDLRRGYYPSYGYYRYQSGSYAYGYGSAARQPRDKPPGTPGTPEDATRAKGPAGVAKDSSPAELG